MADSVFALFAPLMRAAVTGDAIVEIAYASLLVNIRDLGAPVLVAAEAGVFAEVAALVAGRA